jgi:hypothetical protein
MELHELNLIEGHLPKRCRQMVRDWAEAHQDELLEMWKTQKFWRLPPLE